MQPELFTAHDGSGASDHVPVIERLGNELALLKKNMAALLKLAGVQGVCRGCKAEIHWMAHSNGRHAPYDLDGSNHFITCPNGDQFRKRRSDATDNDRRDRAGQ